MRDKKCETRRPTCLSLHSSHASLSVQRMCQSACLRACVRVCQRDAPADVIQRNWCGCVSGKTRKREAERRIKICLVNAQRHPLNQRALLQPLSFQHVLPLYLLRVCLCCISMSALDISLSSTCHTGSLHESLHDAGWIQDEKKHFQGKRVVV